MLTRAGNMALSGGRGILGPLNMGLLKLIFPRVKIKYNRIIRNGSVSVTLFHDLLLTYFELVITNNTNVSMAGNLFCPLFHSFIWIPPDY